jgi:hypothetical protein
MDVPGRPVAPVGIPVGAPGWTKKALVEVGFPTTGETMRISFFVSDCNFF